MVTNAELQKQIQGLQENGKHKPIIETIINTAALALTSFSVVNLTTDGCTIEDFIRSLVLLTFGAGLEFFKYWGRRKKLW